MLVIYNYFGCSIISFINVYLLEMKLKQLGLQPIYIQNIWIGNNIIITNLTENYSEERNCHSMFTTYTYTCYGGNEILKCVLDFMGMCKAVA